MAHVRKSKPYPVLDFQVNVLKTSYIVASSPEDRNLFEALSDAIQLRLRAKKEPRNRFSGRLPENQGQNPALTVFYVPYPLGVRARNLFEALRDAI